MLHALDFICTPDSLSCFRNLVCHAPMAQFPTAELRISEVDEKSLGDRASGDAETTLASAHQPCSDQELSEHRVFY